ncbi:hypothetical protein OOK43_19570 [[Kitasatospora] papulosa]|uniref:hypothetical protein n=1 Tax=[Kitasatospora] papulosa TaxID=1464011 RepID=UPI0022582B1E|nr:hypothetical protein [[Kitasatospora] papulosa]MCX4415466.1 hypothetical protein [[Kitasatospora] papulosa]
MDRHDAHLAGSLLAAVRALSPQGRRITLRHVLLMLDAGERMTLVRAVGKRLPEAEGDADPLDLLARALLALVCSGLGEHNGSQAELRALVRETVREPGRIPVSRSSWAFRGCRGHADGPVPTMRFPAPATR